MMTTTLFKLSFSVSFQKIWWIIAYLPSTPNQKDTMNVLITGCNRGLGLGMVKFFLQMENPPKHIFATVRDQSRAQVSGILSMHLRGAITNLGTYGWLEPFSAVEASETGKQLKLLREKRRTKCICLVLFVYIVVSFAQWNTNQSYLMFTRMEINMVVL